MTRPPTLKIALDELSVDQRKRHEALVQSFGQYVFWIRRSILDDKCNLVESAEARDQLGTIFREPFARMAELDPSQRETAYRFAQECIDGCFRELMRLFAHAGFDLPMTDGNVARFRLILEICDGETGDVLSEEVLNRDGRHFPDYWGRWLNRFGKDSSSENT